MIRQATFEDLPKMAATAREFYAASPTLADLQDQKFCETWHRLIDTGIGVAFIEYAGDFIAGGIGAIVTSDPYGKTTIASEAFWFVSENSRGTLGIRLYRAFEEWAKSHGVDSIQMIHLMDAAGAKVRNLYLRMGYEPVEVRYQKRLN
jgi:GNAT superfamily N-acetyltransferase